MKRPRVLVLAIVVLFIDVLLWASLLPSAPPLNVPFKTPNLINVIGLIASVGLLISILTRSKWLRMLAGIAVIVTHVVLIRMAYSLTKYDSSAVAYLMAGMSLLVIIITAAMFFFRPVKAFFENKANA